MTPAWRAWLTWLTQLSTWTLAHRKHSADLQLMATWCVPWPHCKAAVLHIAHLLGLPAREHLGHQTIIIGGLIARMGVLKYLPVIGKNLLEDTPVPGGCCQHTGAPS